MVTSHQIGAGRSRHSDGMTAARLAARQARQRLAPDLEPGWLLAFVGGRHAPEAVLAGFRAELGPLPIIGGSGVGVIGAAAASATGYECGALLFSSSLAPTAILRVDGLDRDETKAGYRLGTQLRTLALQQDTVVLLFYASLKSSPPPVLHLGSRLLDGLHQGLASSKPLLVGAGMLTDMDLSGGYVLDGEQALRHAAVAVVLPSQLVGYTTIMHGCIPASDFLEISSIDGPRVLELAGRPALQVVEERLGTDRAELLNRAPLPLLTLGEKHGDPYAPFNDNQYVNRLVVSIDPLEESLILFESDFQAGSRVQLMSYEPGRMIESARSQTGALMAAVSEHDLVFGLYIDCAGRSMAFSGMDEDESAPVRERVSDHCPFIGFYSGVEVAPFMGRARPLDWTGVLLLCRLRS